MPYPIGDYFTSYYWVGDYLYPISICQVGINSFDQNLGSLVNRPVHKSVVLPYYPPGIKSVNRKPIQQKERRRYVTRVRAMQLYQNKTGITRKEGT